MTLAEQIKFLSTLPRFDDTQIKVELEAELNRNEAREVCSDCDGGYHDCPACGGTGTAKAQEIATLIDVECDSCRGDGRVECGHCGGSGTLPGRFSDGEGYYDYDNTGNPARDYIVNHVSAEAKRALMFDKFYADGSVDSEFTFTLPVSKIKYIPEFIKAMADLGKETGTLDTDGAGMHISVMPSSDYDGIASRNLLSTGITNFSREVTKLLPSLYWMASSNHKSRSLEYRRPRISREEKQSAIYTHGNTMFEYRLFETCYEAPERFFDFLTAICKTLRYYANPTATVPALGIDFAFTGGRTGSLGRFFKTPEHMRVLQSQLKHIKPDNKTITALRRERKFYLTVAKATQRNKTKEMKLRADYEEYARRTRQEITRLRRYVTEARKAEIREFARTRRSTYASAERRILGLPTLTSFARFKQNTEPSPSALITT